MAMTHLERAMRAGIPLASYIQADLQRSANDKYVVCVGVCGSVCEKKRQSVCERERALVCGALHAIRMLCV